ncbi:hypothetical protein FOQG_18957 [Fusarium oxysporum f. sp. raphani 54005]|uniref:Uncharacterized protein n=1 Tax=Fusarium oxysporum f. sp. raphani 54005 TaxID=1089458 RepID=X0B2F9_FUSOX|nr:hypothetical protein FOQG_18957 [Fusarium oxysporum f. sp. raphani 54005]
MEANVPVKCQSPDCSAPRTSPNNLEGPLTYYQFRLYRQSASEATMLELSEGIASDR